VSSEPRESLAEVLAARGDPLAGARSSWAEHLLEIPEDSAAPLAMSGPHPLAVGSYGPDLLKWAKKELRFTPRWWQELALVRQFEHDADGLLVWRDVIESGPRRIGKSVRLRVSAVWRTAHADLFGETQLSMLVSKDLMIGKEIHAKAWAWAEKRGWIVQRRAGGQEIRVAEAEDSDRWLLRAPDGAYGYDVCYGQVDEAWDIKPDVITDGLEPALLERFSPQLHLTSTAHVRASSLMRGRLMNALKDVSDDTLLLLWGAHPDADVDDPATWRAASPHWSDDRERLVTEKWKAAKLGGTEVDDPDPMRGWAAQYLNVWPFLLNDVDGVLPVGMWTNGNTDTLPSRSGPQVAVDVRTGLEQSFAIAVADRIDEHHDFVDLIQFDWGLGTRPERDHIVAEVCKVLERHKLDSVAIDTFSDGNGALVPLFQAAGVKVNALNTADMRNASVGMKDAIVNARLQHLDNPYLLEAVKGVGVRKSGEGFIFTQDRSKADITPLRAATAAWWALQKAAPATYDVMKSFL
jgi:hypothetical protein